MGKRMTRTIRVALSVTGSAILLFSCADKDAGRASASEETMMTEYSEDLSVVMSQNGRRSYHFVTPLLEGYSLAREPYREFRKGVKITTYQNDSLTTVDAVLTKENVSECDIVLIAVRPGAAISYLREAAPHIGARPVVIDCCGVKREVCETAFALAREHGFTFLGGHPMAGSHRAGYKNARANLFHAAPMVLVPPEGDDIALLARAKELLAPAEFGKFSVTSAAEHDRMIAFTSQLAHIVSNAYIKSPTARSHRGFSAGSYKDLTRVAWLDPSMWAELFLDNRDNVLFELESLAKSLAQYRAAVENNDLAALTALLDEGRRRKEEVDGR